MSELVRGVQLRSALPDDAPERLIELGRIAAAHGVAGWVKVQPYAGASTVLLRVKKWWLHAEPGGAFDAEPVTVQAARLQGHSVIAQLHNVTDRDQAEALRGRGVAVPRSAFPAPEADEFYWVDLLGCLLYGHAADTASPVLLGRVADVSDNGAHAVLNVTRLLADDQTGLVVMHDSKGRPLQVLVPFVAAHVHNVDLVARRIDSNWPVDF